MHRQRPQTLIEAIYRLYADSGFAMAGAVAFSSVLSLFPFCIFLGALAGMFGGRDLAAAAIHELFQNLPPPVADGLLREVDAVMGRTRLDVLTLGAGIALFFATGAIETLRTALNVAYRVKETRSYPVCLARSMLFVVASAIVTLALTWFIVVAPRLAELWQPEAARFIFDASWFGAGLRYAVAAAMIALQLFAYHIWLAAGRRRISEVWPGVVVSTVLWLLAAGLYSSYLNLSDYTRFYAGLSQLMVALIFFQVSAVIVLLGAELNRGLIELRKLDANDSPRDDIARLKSPQ
jgi:membrane protein